MVEGSKHGKEKIILLIGVFLVMTGLGITLPVLPFYIEKLLALDGISSKTVSLHVGLITGSFPLTQFLFSSYLAISSFFMLTTSRQMDWILLYVSFISIGMAILTPSLASLITKDSEKEYGTSLGVFSSVNSLGQLTGVVIGGVIMIWSDHLAYWLVAATLIVVAYLVSRPDFFMTKT